MCKLSLSVLSALLCLLAVVQAGVVAPVEKSELRQITVVKDVRAFVAKHPGLKLQRMVKLPTGRAGSESVRYTLGARVSGDTLVAQGADVFAYPTRKDVSIQLTYPESGVGAVVTYVDLTCTQDNSEGNAYVIAGGIGQRFISIILEANQTEKFAYQAQYFGKN